MATLFQDTYDILVGYQVETVWIDTGGVPITVSVHGRTPISVDDWLIYTDDPASGVDSEPQDVFVWMTETPPDKWYVLAEDQTPLGRWVRVRSANDMNSGGDGRVMVVVETAT